MKKVIDLQGLEGVKTSLQMLLGDKFNDFENHIRDLIDNEKVDEIIDVNYLLDKELIDLSRWSVDDIYLKIYHFTTRKNKDECYSDLLDLPSVLTQETFFSKFLNEFKISFDLKKDEMYFKGNTYNLKSSNEKIKNIASKIYTDPEIWGFLRVIDISKYQDDFPNRPEFIGNLLEFFGYSEAFDNKWKNEYGNPYVIEFEMPLDKVQAYLNCDIYINKSQYMKEKYLDEEDFSVEDFQLHQKKILVELLLRTYFGILKRYPYTILYEKIKELMESIKKSTAYNKYLSNYDNESSQLIACVNKGQIVPKENIINVWDFEDFQRKAKEQNGYLVK